MKPRLVFATTNAGKLAELRGLLGERAQVLSAADLPAAPEVDEDEPTFEGNARKKALAWAQATGLPALADDSGLCVDALDGRPGVLSARYDTDDARRNARLLRELQGVPLQRRTARFECALCLALPGGALAEARGTCEGSIAFAPRGEHGFGYDPLFEVPGTGRTLAEHPREEKAAFSHRGRAFRALLPQLLRALGVDA